jgi:hypothetical protein
MEIGKVKAPWWFWVIAVLYILWSFVGCAGYLAEHLMSDAAYGEAFGAEMLSLRDLTPIWATAGYAFGVWGGLVGGILLLLRKKLCLSFFYASFIGAVIGFLPSIFDGRFKAVMKTGDYGFMVFIWLICLFIIWFARKILTKAIIR